MLRLLVNADFQLHHEIQAEQKHGHVDAMLALVREGRINAREKEVDVILIPGDHVDHGRGDEVNRSNFFRKLFCRPPLTNEWRDFQETVYTPLRREIPVYLCAGNHDTYGGGQPLRDIDAWVGRTFDKTINGVRIISLDIYPNDSILDWLAERPRNNTPTIFFFHYPLNGPHSGLFTEYESQNWWGDAATELHLKTRLYAQLQQFHVLGIFLGHAHGSYTIPWRGYPTYVCGGALFADVIVARDAAGNVTMEVVWRDMNNNKFPALTYSMPPRPK